MTKTETDASQIDRALPCWAVLSLQDGLAADAVYHDRNELTRLNSTFWERSRAAFRRDGLGVSPILDVFYDARHCLLVPVDAEQIRRDRFRRALKLGMIDAIGYRLPRDPSARPVLIPSQVWEHGQLDWDKSELSGAGFAFTHLRILIAARIFEAHDLPYQVAPLPELDCFAPSDEKRIRLDIPTSSLHRELPSSGIGATGTDQATRVGRSTLKQAIIAAFDVIEKSPNWSDKELTNAIRDHVKQERGLVSDKNLSHRTIIDHVRGPWDEYLNSPPSD